jgi:hypothetical protein
LPGTVENPEIIDVIKDVLKDEGYPRESLFN